MEKTTRMILRFLFVVGVCLVSPAWGSLSRVEFEQFLEPTCFRLDEEGNQLINGQTNPLPQTIENFIALAEKFEVANPKAGLKEELFYFIRNYTYNNIDFNLLGDVIQWQPKDTRMDDINTLWEPNEVQRERLPEVENPFSDDEKCSLFYMLSHSIIREPRKLNQQRATSSNYTKSSLARSFSLDEQYPMEIGVVAIRGTNIAVSLGRVLKGLYVGLQNNREKDINDYPRIPKEEIPAARMIDPLYSLTVAEVIALSTWRPEVGSREKLAAEGRWVSASIALDPEHYGICPMIYRLTDGTTAAYSSSSLRGAADGLILGKIIDSVEMKNKDVKLSQVLRMYYSRNGILEKDEELGSVWASFCNRASILEPLEAKIKEQTDLYQLLAANSYKNIKDSSDYAWRYYLTMKTSVLQLSNQELYQYCGSELTIDKPENLPLETPLELITIMDTNADYFKRQQLILGYFAKGLDLQYAGSRMTIFTNQRLTSPAGSASGTLALKPIVTDSYSSACVACAVTQISADDTASAPEDEVIIALNQLLTAKKDNQTKHSGVKGKVIIYFNFQAEEKTSRPSSAYIRVEKALRDLHLTHQDVAIYPLGRTVELVKKYARNDGAFGLSAVDDPEDEVARKLLERLLTAPATLQYNNCETGNYEKTAVYEDFISPNAIQHWAMPAKYFYKSRNFKVSFESQYGPIRVCYHRATPSPELQKDTCHDIPMGQKKDIPDSNPCRNLDSYSCPPLYFAVLGVNATNGDKQAYCVDTNTENRCRTLDQIKFKVSHEGIRCSGSSTLLAMPVLLLGIFLLNLISKKL